MIDVVMPEIHESIFEGTLTKWLKKRGDRVELDEPLFEISTDKVDTEIPSPSSGVLAEILVLEGVTVSINSVVGRIREGPNPRVAPASSSPSVPLRAPPPISEAARFFISYSSRDAEKATEICGFLHSLGVNYWIAPDSIPPGDVFSLAIARAIRECDCFLLLFSSNSDDSVDVMSEITLARKYKKRIIPVRIEAFEPEKLEYHLGPSQWVEFYGALRPKGEVRLKQFVNELR